MPYQLNEDKLGFFITWGAHGKKYYFDDQISFQRAHTLAHRQQQAEHFSKRGAALKKYIGKFRVY